MLDNKKLNSTEKKWVFITFLSVTLGLIGGFSDFLFNFSIGGYLLAISVPIAIMSGAVSFVLVNFINRE